MKYVHDPERPKEPILEASPREIDAHRDWLRRCLRSSWSLDDADVEDAVQNAVIVVQAHCGKTSSGDVLDAT